MFRAVRLVDRGNTSSSEPLVKQLSGESIKLILVAQWASGKVVSGLVVHRHGSYSFGGGPFLGNF